jgi:hypothetical protein
VLEADTCPTTASTDATRLHEEVPGTRTDTHVPTSKQQPRELHDVTMAKRVNDQKTGPNISPD